MQDCFRVNQEMVDSFICFALQKSERFVNLKVETLREKLLKKLNN